MDEIHLRLDRTAARPIRRQIVEHVIDGICSGVFMAGERLPSSREMATELGVSRSTVVAALLELDGEGWVDPRPGSGVYVTHRRATPIPRRDAPYPSSAGSPRWDLRPGRADPTLLSSRAWRAAWQQHGRSAAASPPSAGEPELLRALASYLEAARGVVASSSDLVVCSGTGEAVTLLGLAYSWAGRRVVVEDPCHPLVRSALRRIGADVVAVDATDPVAMVDTIVGMRPAPVAVHLTPNHQYPLGQALEPAQHRRLHEWSSRVGALLVENDHNSEYRFEATLADTSTDAVGEYPVVHLGTMSQILDPGLRLSYLCMAGQLAGPVKVTREDLGASVARPVQLVVARLIRSGELARHTARLKRLYGDRRVAMLTGLRRIPAVREVRSAAAGLHLTAMLDVAVPVDEVLAQAAARDLALDSLDRYRESPNRSRPGLVLGFAHHAPAQIRAALEVLRSCPALADTNVPVGTT